MRFVVSGRMQIYVNLLRIKSAAAPFQLIGVTAFLVRLAAHVSNG